MMKFNHKNKQKHIGMTHPEVKEEVPQGGNNEKEGMTKYICFLTPVHSCHFGQLTGYTQFCPN